jgi:putative membrane protein
MMPLSTKEIPAMERARDPASPGDYGLGPLVAIFAPGLLLWWLSVFHPAHMPFWGPWNFSWLEYLASAFAVFWFWRGLTLQPPAERPHILRRIAYFAGLGAIYAVTQTHYDYMAQHMFFLNRIQHVIMHHIGPFLIVLGRPGPTLQRGMPERALQITRSRFVVRMLDILQQPFLAAFLFVGLLFLWLTPAVHFRAMLDDRLYALMNWSMVVDGVLFWALALDHRPKPPARVSYGMRLLLAPLVMLPQIALGAIITFAQHDIYPFFTLCGRLFPSLGAIDDQHLAGVIIWIPSSMMSVIGALIVLNSLRLHEQTLEETDHDPTSPTILTSWTG